MVGIIKRVPREVIEELNKIKIDLGVDKDSEAFREMTNYSILGRGIEQVGRSVAIFPIRKGRKK